MVVGQLVASDDVDVGLGELPIASFLRTLTTPDLLHLVATEGKVQVPGVLQHVAGERNRQVEVEAEFIRIPFLCMQAPDDVDLLVDLPLAGQLVEGFDGPGLNGSKAMEFEGGCDGCEYLVLHQAPSWKELGETGDRFRACHGSVLQEISLQVGIVKFFGPDGGGFPVPGQQYGFVGEGLDDSAQGDTHLLQIPSGKIGTPNGAPEDHVPSQQHLPGVVPDFQECRSGGMSWSDVRSDFKPAGNLEDLMVPQVGRTLQQILAEKLPYQGHQPGSQSCGRPGEHLLVGFRASNRNIPYGRQGRSITDMIEMSVCAQDDLRMPTETIQGGRDQLGSLHARIDDKTAVLIRISRDEIAVRGPRGNGNGLDTHAPNCMAAIRGCAQKGFTEPSHPPCPLKDLPARLCA